LLDGEIDQERLQKAAGEVADAILRYPVHEELDFLEVTEAGAIVLGDELEQIEDLLCLRLADPFPLSVSGRAESNFITLRSGDEGRYCLRILAARTQIAKMIECVEQAGMQCLVLLRRRAPQQERVRIQRNILVQKRDREIQVPLRDEYPIVIG
jgi:hypothetical protein